MWTATTRAQHKRDGLRFASDLTDAEWAVVDALLADALEDALRPLVDGNLITALSRHDTDPANNLPIPPEHQPHMAQTERGDG